MIRVGVFGAGGRMGRTVCAAVERDGSLDLAATVGRNDALGAFVDGRCDVVVDFTIAEAARAAVPWLLEQGIHVVSGTTGLSDADLADFRAATAGGGHALIASNFAISAVLTMKLCELAAPFFDTVEVIELHHDGKVDAPSGTSLAIVDRIAAAKGEWAPDPTTHTTVAGVRGGEAAGGIHVHSVRMRGMVAHQEVIFGTTAQTLTIRQDSYSAESFMPGVVLACKRIAGLPGLTVGLDALLA